MLWKGRFKKELDKKANAFNASIGVDKALAEQDITGSLAHAAMLAQTDIISQEDCKAITDGLQQILAELQAHTLTVDESCEDIHTFVESLLTERIGDAGKRLHTARSRNDQVATDFRLYLKEEAAHTTELLKDLCETLCDLASEHTETIMPGYTHLQRAQPIVFGHHLMAYTFMFLRDIDRIKDAAKRMNVLPLGAGALAGTTFPIDRNLTAQLLGFDKPCENSLDAVSDRDFVLELSFCLSVVMTHISRLCEEIILWNSWEFKFVELDDSYTTGSSIMPQKKNPDVAETARGKAGRVAGDLISLTLLMKGLPLAYAKDTQEDKEPVFDAIDTVKDTLRAFVEMMPGVVPNREEMKKAAQAGYPTATDLADYLTKKGLPFREAHDVVGSVVRLASNLECDLAELTLEQLKDFCPMIEEDVYEKALKLESSIAARDHLGGTAPAQVKKQVARWHGIFAERHAAPAQKRLADLLK